jgi:hypothetical protein
MYPLYYFQIKLTKDSPWRTEIGYSISHIMAHLATYDTMPYAYIKGNQL